ncbi:MAG: response regulator, partial [Desulfobacterales bacterium]
YSISVLEYLKWMFKDEPYYIFTLDNPFDALNVINTLEWAVVVAERYMKNMDGLEFLKKVRARSPQTMGIIMTSDSEIKKISDAAYPGSVFQFVKKPVDSTEIKQAVKTAITDYERNRAAKSVQF